MLAQLGKTAALVALIAAPTVANAGGYGHDRYGGQQASDYASESYSASTRIEEEAHGVTGVIDGRGRAHVTGAYHDGYASGGGYGVSSEDGYGQAPYGHLPANGGPCPPGGGERVLKCVFVPHVQEIHLSDSFFAGGGGVGPDYIAGGGGGGGFVMVGGMASAGARASSYASASASASAYVSISGGGRRHGGKGVNKGGKGGGCCH